MSRDTFQSTCLWFCDKSCEKEKIILPASNESWQSSAALTTAHEYFSCDLGIIPNTVTSFAQLWTVEWLQRIAAIILWLLIDVCKAQI